MKYSFALAVVLVHAMANPITRPPLPDSNANAIVQIRLIGDASQHYSTGNTQKPSTPSGSVLSILVGQSLDFKTYAPQLQAVEIARITQGESLEGVSVEDMDERVVCKAFIEGSSDGSTFSAKDAQVLLDGGRMVKLTGLACRIT